jgi:hypothetical protein
MPLRAHMLRHLQLHECLAQHSHPFPQEIHILAHLCLAQQLLKCHAQLVGHPVLLLSGFNITTR